jgi:hypothetical protein
VSTAVWGVLFLVFAVASLVVGYETAMHFAGVAIDGPFQLYNALRRIQAGFRPGVDFQFFHGLGVPYAHYWLYRMFGGGLRGSELARELLATALYPCVYVIVFRAFCGSWPRAFALSAAAMAASYLLHMSAMLFAVSGMLSLRSALPTLLPVVLLLSPTRNRRIVAVGITLGLAMFISTEQGLAAVLAFVIVSVVAAIGRTHVLARAIETVATFALAIVVLVVALLMVGGLAGMRGALRYNFRLVPMDQYWFFGSPPNVFLPSWREGTRMLLEAPVIGLAIVLSVVAALSYFRRLWRERREEPNPRDFALAILSLYGLISCGSLLGVFTMAYVQPCLRALIIVGLLEGSRLASTMDARKKWNGVLGVPTGAAVVSLGLWSYALATISLVPTALTTSLPHIFRDHVFGAQRFSIAGIWPATLRDAQRAVDAHRAADGRLPTIWSTYAGWIEARNGVFHPSFDYVIHALGPENRAAYVDRLRATQPQLVQTIRPTYTPYEAWLENNDWAVYDELLDWYKVYSTTPWSIFWERRPTRAESLQLIGTVAVPKGATTVQFPPAPPGSAPPMLLEVEIEYQTTNPLASLPMVGASPRYLVGIDGAVSRTPVSLSPFARRTRFPLVVAPGQAPTLHFQTFSLLPGASWAPATVRLFVRPLDSGNAVWMADLVAALKKPI